MVSPMVHLKQKTLAFLLLLQAATAHAAPIQEICEASGAQGVAQFANLLGVNERTQFYRWQAERIALPLNAPSTAEGIFAFCPLGSACATVANWYLSMSPLARIRREAAFFALSQLAKTEPVPVELRQWADVRAYLQNHAAVPAALSREADARIEALRLIIHQRPHAALLTSISEGLCFYFSVGEGCRKAVGALFAEVSPRAVGPREWPSLPVGAVPLALSMPEEMARLARDARYTRALFLVNSAMLERITQFETSSVAGGIPSLDSTLDAAVADAFVGESTAQRNERKMDLLAFYGSRGSSFLGLRNYLPTETRPLLIQYGAFASLINYVDALQKETGQNGEGYFSLPGHLNADCLQSKPYHQILARSLSEKLKNLGLNKAGVAEATLLMAFAYRLATLTTESVAPESLGARDSLFYETRRMDLILSTIGILKGLDTRFELDPAAALIAMERSVGAAQNQSVVPGQPSRPMKLGLLAQVRLLYQSYTMARGLGVGSLLEILDSAAKD